MPGLGPRRCARLLARFGTPEALLRASREELARLAPTLPPALLAGLANPDWAAVTRDLRWLEQPGHHLLTPADRAYPALLRQLPDAPPVLFVRGAVALLADPQIAIVGSRSPSADGRRQAFEFSRYLVARGLTVTSGLALGIDGEAHAGALAGGGGTVAVLGTGIDRIYPARHAELGERLLAGGGALVSELPLGSGPRAEHFPRRNRIISGLSLATLVVEAARQSGSLITARLAAEQGRDVFAVPGSIHNPMVKGCHALIRDGARLVESAQDLLVDLAPQLRDRLQRIDPPEDAPPATPGNPPAAYPETLGADYRRLLALLDDGPAAIDQLAARSGLTVAAVSSMLLILELQDLVSAAAGGIYSRPAARATYK